MPALPMAPGSARGPVRAWASPARRQKAMAGGLSDLWLGRPIPGLRWPTTVLRAGGLGALLYFVITTPPAHGPHGLGVGVLVPLAVASLAWMGWVVSYQRPLASGGARLVVLASAVVLGAAGAVLLGLSLSPFAEVFPCVAVFFASVELAPRWSVPVLAGVVAVIIGAFLAGQPPPGGLAQ